MTQAKDPNERKFYVYLYLNRNGRPLYVGRGCGNRWKHHMRQTAKSAKSANALLRREIIAAGGELPVVMLREHLTDAQASEIEMAFIAALGRGARGILVNRTDGGEGCVGVERTPEHNAKIGAKSKGRKWTDEQTRKIKASYTPERKAQQGAAVSAFWTNMTPEARAARIAKTAAAVRAAMTPEVCAKINANRGDYERKPNKGRTGQPWTAEHRAKVAERWKERKARGWHSEATKAKIAEAHRRNGEAKRNGAV